MANEAEPDTQSLQHQNRFAVFGNRNFRLLWTGAIASNIGTWMQQVALGWLIVTLTNSPGWLGAVALAGSIPFLVVPLFGGVIADRVDRIKLLKTTQSFAMVLAFLLAALSLAGVIEIWQILVMALLNSTAASFEQPTRNALLPDLVPENQLMQALSLQSTSYQGAALLGPAIAGLLVGVIGSGGCFLINGLSYLFVIVALFMMKVPAREPRIRTAPMLKEMGEGLRFLRHSPVLLAVLFLTCVYSLFGRSYGTLLPAFAKLVLDTNAESLGLMYAMPGLGTLIGGFALAAYGDLDRRGTFLALTAILTGAAVGIFGFASELAVLLPTLVLIGIATTAFNATVSTIMQVRSPGAMRGRVMSYNTIAWRGLTPLGGGFAGLTAELFGTRAAIAGGGLVVITVTVLLYALTPFLRHADRTDANAVPAPAVSR